jgi:O-antigen/teichoic acid export membrane protein
MSYLAGQIDLVVLNAVAGAEAIAVYKIAKSLSTIPVRATAPLWSALRPRLLAAWHAGRPRRVLELVGLPALGMLGAMLLAAAPVVMLAPWLIGRVYGAEYATAAVPFLHLVWGTLLFQSLTGWFGFWVIIAEQRTAGTLVYALYLALLAIGAAVYGRHGSAQMALAVAVASGLSSVVCWALFVARTRALGASARGELADAVAA